MRNNWTWFLLLSLLAVTIAPLRGDAQVAVNENDPVSLLQAMQEHYQQMKTYQSDGQVLYFKTSPLEKPYGEQRFTVRVAKPNRYRIKETSATESMARTFNVHWNDGSGNHGYGIQNNVRVDYPSRLSLPMAINGRYGMIATFVLGELLENKNHLALTDHYEPIGTDYVYNEPCYVVKMSNGSANYTYWIAKDRRVLVKLMVTQSGGPDVPGVIVEYHSNITEDAPIADDELTYAPPANARVFRQE